MRRGARCGELLWCACCRTAALTQPSLPAVRPHQERCVRVGTCCRGANIPVGHWRLQAARGCSQLCRPQAPVPGRSSTALSLQSCSLRPPCSRAAPFLLRRCPQAEDEALPRAPYSRTEWSSSPPSPRALGPVHRGAAGCQPRGPAPSSECLVWALGSGFILLLSIAMKTPPNPDS